MPDRGEISVRYLDKTQLRRLLEVAREYSAKDHLLFLVTYAHALRASEAVAIRRSDIQDGFLTVKRLKGSLRTCQPLVTSGDPLFNEKPLLEACGPGLLFPGYTRHTFNNRVRKYGSIAMIPKHLRFPHSLKHSLLYHALNADPEKRAKINELQTYAGHKSGSSTMKYLVCDEQTASKAVIGAILAA